MDQEKGLEKVLSYSIKTGLYLTLIMPLLVFRGVVFPFVFSKAIYFQLLIEILAILALIYFIFRERKEKKFLATPLFWALLAYLIVSFISALVGVDFQRSFWSTFERMDGLFFLIHLIIFFWLLRVFFSENDWRRFWWGFLGVSVLAGILSLAYYGFEHRRLVGILGNPIYLGTFLLFSVFSGGFLLAEAKKISCCLLIAAATLFSIVLIFLSASRGPILGLGLGLFLAAVLLFFSGKKFSRHLKIGLSSLFLTFCLLLGLIYAFHNSFLVKRIGLKRITFLSERHGESRLLSWQIALKAWQDRFFLGWGRENYEVAFNKHLNPEIFKYAGRWFDRPHNKYLEVAVNGGVLGLLAYFSILGILGFYLLKLYRKQQILVIFFSALLFAYLFQNFFAFDVPVTYFCFFGGMAFLDFNYQFLVCKELAGKEGMKRNRVRKAGLARRKILAFIIIPLLAFSFYYSLQAFKASCLFRQALLIQENPQGSPQEIIKIYQRSLKLFPQNQQQLSLVIANKMVNQAVKGDTRFFHFGILNFLKQEIKKSIEFKPLNAKNYLVLIRIYQLLGISAKQKQYFTKAEKVAFGALKIYPLRPDFYYEIAKTEKFLGNTEKAAQYFKKAYPLMPSPSQ